MNCIIFSKNKMCKISWVDYDIISEKKWHLSDTGYFVHSQWLYGQNKGTTILMHRLINNTPNGLHTDHINGNKLDNRRTNLRQCTIAQNMGNRKIISINNTSGYKGVSYHKGKWAANIRYNYKKIYLGVFNNKNDAAAAYNKKALELFGDFAKLNIL